MTISLRRRLASVAALAALATGAAACSSGSDVAPDSAVGSAAERDSGRGAGDSPRPLRKGTDGVPSAELADDAGAFSVTDVQRGAAGESAGEPAEVADTAKVISTGNVALRSPDVGRARFEVQKVVDRYAGEVAQEETATDDDGEVERSRLVLRVPSTDFAEAMEALEDAADLVTSSTARDDVTTEVLDTDIRVRVQRRSIRRIELLLDRAESIRDIVNIESQLSSRQARLASLEKQQAYLADKTSMATVVVSLERTPEKVAEKEADEAGFVSGLSAGWGGLVSVAVGLATVAGALLPFLAVALLLAIPAWPLLRRLRRRPASPAQG